MLTYSLIRTVTQAFSLILGSIGVFCLWVSFYVPNHALDAILLLSTATALTIALSRGK